MLTVATWNLENLFRPATGVDPAAYARKLDALAAMIERIAPDVLAVQEVGDPDAIEDLLALLAGDWHSVLSPDPDARGIRVGFLARHPLSDIEPFGEFPEGTEPVRVQDDGSARTRMGRGALKASVTVAGMTIDLVTAHLKSKLLHFAGNRFAPRDEGERARYAGYALALRTAEAITVRDHVTRTLEDGDRALVVLGDLNDEPLAATTQILLGPPGSELDTGGFDRPDRGDRQRLWNVAPRLPADRAFSRVFNGRGELIDHILVSHPLAQRLASAYRGTTDLPSIRTAPRRDARGSDHSPVLARFTTP
jgi:endonuclease/exonuclease/phosphatase family metal-dependent hydrolase